MKILVLCGPPASGKSTCARGLVKNNKEWVMVCRDSIRESRGDYWIPSQEDYISDVEEFQVRAAIKRGLNVIIDATNLNPKTINKWDNLAKELKCEIEYREFYIPFKEAVERDKKRERPVGKEVLKTFYKKYYLEEYNKEMSFSDNRFILKQDYNLPKCVIVDIDGTIALNSGRSPYDYSRVNEDKVNPPMRYLLNILSSNFPEDLTIIFLSGREGSEECESATRKWLKDNFPTVHFHLLMRKQGDFRKDFIIKEELYKQYIKDNYYVLCIFDDRDSVVRMWRDNGLLTLQVYYGDF